MKKLIFVFISILIGLSKQQSINYYEHSPIDIVRLTKDSMVKYPANPKLVLNSTIYYHLNNVKLRYVNNNTDLILDVPDMGNAFVLIYNKSYSYRAEKVAVKVYAEHSFNGNLADLEFQIYHTINGNLPLKKDLGDFDDPDDFKFLVISVRFSANKDKTSKKEVIRQLTKVDYYQTFNDNYYLGGYYFNRITDIDFNRYTNFDDPYYVYKGSSTLDEYTKTNMPMYWILMENVQYMDIEELENLQLALYQASGETKTTNSKSALCSTRKGNSNDEGSTSIYKPCNENLIIYYAHPQKDKKSK